MFSFDRLTPRSAHPDPNNPPDNPEVTEQPRVRATKFLLEASPWKQPKKTLRATSPDMLLLVGF